ncbi:MAG: HAMP domain-containing sensor histidine kinase [Clostridiales bacterium]|nr:HAMP domain-containing sensor histidine kinase [Clostridiales bacterium]
MITRIKTRFILLSMVTLFVLLAVIVAGMNVMNYKTIVADADSTLDLIATNKGAFPDFSRNKPPKHMTKETPYESRYFSVLMDENHQIIQIDTSRIKAVDTKKAVEYAAAVVKAGKKQGFIGGYRFLFSSECDSTRIVFLDCDKRIASFQTFLGISSCMALGGYLAFFFVLLFFSKIIMKPVTESYEKQKQFITNAGHEIKTPLAIIQADVDVLEMELGENEWLNDIQKQTNRLAALTNDLICLSRMEEAGNSMPMLEFSFSDVVSESAASFHALAQTQGKVFCCDIQPMISFVGNETAIRQLVNILMDNALKYAPQNGTISITAQKQERLIALIVFNTTENPIPKDCLPMVFERFYRMDSSRSTQTGGYGIGLSVAKAIVTAHGGNIYASAPDGRSMEITVQFPIAPH